MTDLTQDRLKELINYNPIDGVFTWKKKRLNGALPGDIAGAVCKPHGYRKIKIDGKLYSASRLAFLYMEGYNPENDVDHIDRNRSNDKWENLRHISRQCNMRNKAVYKNSNSKITGVTWHKVQERWQAYITVNKKMIYLGAFKDKLTAVKARWEAEKAYKFPNCNTISSAYNYLKEAA